VKSENNIQQFARQIIKVEVEAVEQLVNFVDEQFEKAVFELFNMSGRVIITGIGKSAIIASKIVATLNSTGTPAVFMHAADAIHGDLGIIRPDDKVICISKSGNTPEIKVLIPLIRNLGNLLIGMVGNLDSYLAHSADLVINTYVSKEACPNNLAPTSSTTAQLVMGDALAMCLLKLRGFTPNDFAKVHPGGALGKKLYTRVEDIISPDLVPRVNEEASLDTVIIEISSKMLGATAVENDKGEMVGIITDGDLRRMLQKKQKLFSFS
jgi:arabinose-5-phosphate isomerase